MENEEENKRFVERRDACANVFEGISENEIENIQSQGEKATGCNNDKSSLTEHSR